MGMAMLPYAALTLPPLVKALAARPADVRTQVRATM